MLVTIENYFDPRRDGLYRDGDRSAKLNQKLPAVSVLAYLGKYKENLKVVGSLQIFD
jgi:hypothetical protein